MAEIILELKNEEDVTGKASPAGSKLVWVFPWFYKESFLIALGLLIIGFSLELTSSGTGAEALHYPYNVAFGLTFIFTGAMIKYFFKKHPFVKWMASVPAALSSIALVFLMVVFLGIIPQANLGNVDDVSPWIKTLGLTHVTTSWPFILALLYLLTTLLFSIFKRLYPLNLKNGAFFINHAGLWIALFAGFLGTGDFKRLRMDMFQDEVVWQAYDENSTLIDLPLALRLNKFDIEEYNPNLVMVNHHSWDIIPGNANTPLTINSGESAIIKEWEVSIDRFYNSAFKNGGTFVETDMIGSGPAAFVKAKNLNTGEEVEGWTTSGSFVMNSEMIKISDELSLAMTLPEPKRFSSEATVFTASGDFEHITLEVNKPYSINGWKIYQTSYDDRFGKWSQLSVVELIRDPWLPVVYTGIFMMIIGAVYLMWVGKETLPKNENNL
jgi:hypothetical protein